VAGSDGKAGTNERHHVFGVWISAQHRLREYQLTADMHVEDATTPWYELEDADVPGELFENPRRQTDGVRLSASGDAVFDTNR
jgi:hypothetical protein